MLFDDYFLELYKVIEMEDFIELYSTTFYSI